MPARRVLSLRFSLYRRLHFYGFHLTRLLRNSPFRSSISREIGKRWDEKLSRDPGL